ncbi:nucleotidyltransferase domain-containing protein [Halomonas sp. PGE1]|uniref:nucleotidyltransferase domain-containing protein n=1 Tax=Halomonas sp. PGE1 TaxID=2730360 RepID=UPI0014744356|nr:nucleotidyltransferase domain-containing protein [Halomonas sp. PGE1]QJQ97658.1 nucleotidyltransferase domain-containing protein [Halomonas sp. PGE1]
MRLTPAQREIVLTSVHELAGKAIEVRVFGSRLDDSRRGGDLDLLLVSNAPISLLIRAELKQALEARLQLPVDIVSYTQGEEPTPFQAIALHRSRPLTIEDAA